MRRFLAGLFAGGAVGFGGWVGLENLLSEQDQNNLIGTLLGATFGTAAVLLAAAIWTGGQP